jgi:hypothetical protein
MADEEGGKTDPKAEPSDGAEEIDDTEGQALTWKVKKPIPEVDDDAEGHSVRPPPEGLNPLIPTVEEDDAEGHSGPTGSPRPPVD